MVKCTTLRWPRPVECRTIVMGGWLFFTWLLVCAWFATGATAQGQETADAPSAVQMGEKETSSNAASQGAKDAVAKDAVAENDLAHLQQQLRRMLGKVMPAVVAISGGSGVVISEDGYVLTVAHVGTRAGRPVRVLFPDGRRVWGRTLGNDKGVDAGLIKLSGDGPYPHAEMGSSEKVQPGQWCAALGYPVSFARGKNPAVRIGRVLRSTETALVTDCTIMGGDSGGPLFDMDGRVIGVSSRCDDRLTVNIHVPVDCYHSTWDRLAKGEDFNSRARVLAFLGVAPDESTDAARIGEVFPGTAAAKAGLQVGDVLLKFDGQELSKYSQLPPLIVKHKPGDSVQVVVRRGDEELTLKAKLGQREQ